MAKASIQALRDELASLRERLPALKDDDLFVAWFLRAFVTDSDDLATGAVIGGPHDKSVDAVLIDDHGKMIFILQGKYRQEIGAKNESRNDIIAFADIAKRMCGEKKEFSAYTSDLNPMVRQRLEAARERIAGRGYRLQLYYVTLGKCSDENRREAAHIVRQAEGKGDIDIVDGRRILLILGDYLDGVAPPVPSLDLEMEAGSGVRTSGVLQRYDGKVDIESWVFSMNGAAAADLYEKSGERLFARNVRGFLGSTDINRNMEHTLYKEPEHFWYFNNGITMICDKAERVGHSGRDILRVENPQIINGQQTTRELHRMRDQARLASALVRVIRLPRERDGEVAGFEQLVGKIVMNTNWQNKISALDLKANDHRQIELERGFKKHHHFYLRKRRTKSEARIIAGKSNHIIKKEEVAQAVAACDLDPSLLRTEGKEGLFEDRWYDTIFPTADPLYYLPRYWLMKNVSYAAKGYPERAYAKWLVLHFMWKRFAPIIRKRAMAEEFLRSWDSYSKSSSTLNHAIREVFIAALAFYRKKRGKGERAVDISTFFRHRGLHTQFEQYWARAANPKRGILKSKLRRYEGQLTEETEN